MCDFKGKNNERIIKMEIHLLASQWIPEPKGANTASHALKRDKPHFTNRWLSRFRAQKPDFAPDDSVRKHEFEYNPVFGTEMR